ncbi:MAG: histidine phosphatase family protein [Alphaproteobacteria bacterium]|nr:histidine phosphatase family protein [Alphaproteobacteria bacterium]MBV9370877.1 histidine phosphatase family protein [Alphaproteobacteria bacterium]MBV9899667.1 histidine phosphatase family protein [Alphaproteobacteria bacterium]
MKTLILLRHAKSGWDDPILRDFDRPLNPRGRRAAATVAREMQRLGLSFDRVLASPARRVVETIDALGDVLGALSPHYDRQLYLASPETLLEAVRAAPDGAERLLLVGHSPGIEMLALALSAGGTLRAEIEVKYPTASLAEIALPAAGWSQVREGSGELRRFIRPRDLDPALGPDE